MQIRNTDEMTHENPSRRITKGLPSSSNISIDISCVILSKYIHFVNVFIGFLHDRSQSSAVHGRMGAVRNESLKSFKKDDKGTTIELSNISIDISYVILQNMYFLNHLVHVSLNYFTTGNVHLCILYLP